MKRCNISTYPMTVLETLLILTSHPLKYLEYLLPLFLLCWKDICKYGAVRVMENIKLFFVLLLEI